VQFIREAQQKATEFATANAAVLLTAGGVVGTVATGILAARGGLKYAQILHEAELEEVEIEKYDKLKSAAINFTPAVIVGGGTIASIIMAHRVSAAKAAALAAAYGLAERNLSEYREKVAEKLTGPKNAAIGEEISQDRVNRAGDPPNMVIIGDDVLCFDEATDRYFHSSMEKIRGAVNKINEQIHNEDYADASDFYHLLGMKGTEWSKQVGWNRDNMLELKYDTVNSPDGRPCLSIEFAHFPRPDFIEKHT
jgi:hypothetical protein